MYLLVVTHEVADYDAWKTTFDTFPPARGGARSHRIDRSVDNPNVVTIVAWFDTVAQARSHANDPELTTVMAEAGVVGAPRVDILEEVEVVDSE